MAHDPSVFQLALSFGKPANVNCSIAHSYKMMEWELPTHFTKAHLVTSANPA